MTRDEAAQYIIDTCCPNYKNPDNTKWDTAMVMAIEALQERKTGRWIYHFDDLFPAESTQECDQCRTHQSLDCDGNYCPWCGAKMGGAGE